LSRAIRPKRPAPAGKRATLCPTIRPATGCYFWPLPPDIAAG
jgi:hypothetical protein